MINKKLLGQRINTALAIRDKKQKDLAKHLKVTDNTISYFVHGKRTPNIEQMIEIADYLQVSVDFLLGLSKNHTTEPKIQDICAYTGLSQQAIEEVSAIHQNTIALKEMKAQIESEGGNAEEIINNIEWLEISLLPVLNSILASRCFYSSLVNIDIALNELSSMNQLERFIEYRETNKCKIPNEKEYFDNFQISTPKLKRLLQEKRDDSDFSLYKAEKSFRKIIYDIAEQDAILGKIKAINYLKWENYNADNREKE